MAEPARRIDIGFKGGQVLPCRVKQEAWDGLRKALEDSSAERWHELETVDSQVAIDLAAGRLRAARHRGPEGRLLARP